jgi:hypothetical protein
VGSNAWILPSANVGDYARIGARSVILCKVRSHTAIRGLQRWKSSGLKRARLRALGFDLVAGCRGRRVRFLNNRLRRHFRSERRSISPVTRRWKNSGTSGERVSFRCNPCASPAFSALRERRYRKTKSAAMGTKFRSFYEWNCSLVICW